MKHLTNGPLLQNGLSLGGYVLKAAIVCFYIPTPACFQRTFTLSGQLRQCEDPGGGHEDDAEDGTGFAPGGPHLSG